MISGIYHSHSNFSHDGVKSMSEISKWCKERKIDFIILTEHNDDFTPEKFLEYRHQCEHHSDKLLFIPGMEYEFIINGRVVHVGAIGLDKYFDIDENPIPIEIFLDAVRASGGLSILHHPHRIMGELTQNAICKFDFIEAWNVVYDIRYSPNKKVIRQAEQAGFNRQYLASRDIHYFRDSDEPPRVVLEKDYVNSSGDIIEALSTGQYYINSKTCLIRPNGTFDPSKLIYKYLPAVALFHQNTYENLRGIYNKTIKITPPKWLVKAIK